MSADLTRADVVLVDGGGTNIGSVRYALQRLGVDAPLTTDAVRIRAASHVILPGVGAAGPAMQRLVELDLVDTLRALRQPVLGVCLGLQLLFARSRESERPCLGLIPADVERLPDAPALRVPHMGWNRLSTTRPHALLAGLPDEAYAYFVHSYAAPVGDWTLASCAHGVPFSAIVQKDNFFGMQFHPERSAAVGSLLLKNFLTL
jgi:imidazole glycerol-phosphate synthase subunit HisH